MSFADLAERLQPAVVNISTKEKVQVSANPFAGTPFADMFGGMGGADGGRPVTREAQSLGSGFIISSDGYIVTNNHVVSGHSDRGGANATVSSITVIMPDRKEYAAKLVGHDATSDLAVLKINATGLPFVKFGDSSKARVGDWVIAIGNPLGLGGSVTAGIVSAIHRNIGNGGPYDRYIQTDASINQGNSGGPMFDLNGNVIGINSMIASPNGGSVGLGFAIPAELAKPIIETLKGGANVHRGYLGVQIQPLDEGIADSLGLQKDHGELVASVVPGGAAAKAGVRQGDVIARVNNVDVTPDSSLSFIVAGLPVGARVPIEVIRNGQHQTLTAVLAERPSEEKLALIGKRGNGGLSEEDGDKSTIQASKATLGLGLQSLTPEIAAQIGVSESTKGVVIVAIDPSSDAAGKGFQRGDIILSVNQAPTTTPAQVNAIVNAAKAKGRGTVLLYAQHGNNPPVFIPVKLVSDK
jgi:serine protease Do